VVLIQIGTHLASLHLFLWEIKKQVPNTLRHKKTHIVEAKIKTHGVFVYAW